METINYQKLPKIDWIVEEEASDNLYLSEYRIEGKSKIKGKDIAGSTKQRIKQVEKLENSRRYQSINY